MAKSSPARLRAQAKYNRKPAQKKRRAALNKENRRRGTYGNGDGKDLSHKKALAKGGSNKDGYYVECSSKNRARNGKTKKK